MLLMDHDPNGRSKFTGECAADVTGMPGQSNGRTSTETPPPAWNVERAT
jgi:hypothetical protein